MSDKSLWHISTELKRIEQDIFDNDGEITEKQDEIMETLSRELSNKVDGVVHFIREQHYFLDKVESEIKRLREIKAKTENGLERFNGYVVGCMDQKEVTLIEGEFEKIAIRKPSQILEVIDQDEVPTEFIKVKKTISVDKAEIKKRVKNGEDIPGVKLVDGSRKAVFKNK